MGLIGFGGSATRQVLKHVHSRDGRRFTKKDIEESGQRKDAL